MTTKKIIFNACLFVLSSVGFAQQTPTTNKEQVNASLANLPISFRKNMGQWDNQILYQGSSPGWNANVYVMKDQLSFGFTRPKKGAIEEAKVFKALVDEQHVERQQEFLVWNLQFKNCNPNSFITESGISESRYNYLVGDESTHRSNVAAYDLIKYNNIYNNVDIQYYSKGKNLEYDILLKPGGHIEDVQMECVGVKGIEINAKGQLEITTAWGTLLEEIPESYQEIDGEKHLVQMRYKKINATTFGFEMMQPYNDAFALVVDPVNFSWGTFVGGGPGADAYISDITVDANGNVYGTGWCNAVYPVTAGAYDQTYNAGGGYGDAYVFKLNSTATSIVYATYLGGAVSYEQGEGIAVNAAGQVYVAGWTQSTDFPTTAGSFDPTFNGTSFQDIFITKLNATGSALVYSTFVGGMYSDYCYALELNAAGEVYITGYSTNFNLDFPTTAGAYQASALTSQGGVYVLKMNAAGNALVFSTFTGNPSGRGYGLAVDAAGSSYLTGENYGNMDSTAGAFRTIPNANIGIYPDVFAQKINSTGTSLVYSTYLGGSNWDDIYYGDGIDVDLSGNAYIFGYTQSIDFPVTAGSYDAAFSGGSDPFLTKLNPAGTALVYSTFVGQDGIGESVDVNSLGEAFVAGNINSQGFTATACAYDATHNGATDCFVGKINAAGNNALYLSYFGGTQSDYGNGPFGKVKLVLAGQCEDKVYVCTTSHSTDFPTTPGTVQPVKLNSGADQPVVFHIKPVVTPNFTYVVGACNAVNFTDATTGSCVWQSGAWTPSAWTWNFGDGATATTQNPTHIYGAAGTYNVKLIVSCPLDSITISVTVSSSGLVLTTATTPTTCGASTGTASVNVTTGTGPFTYSWAPSGGTGATASNLAAATYTVTVSNGSCSSTATATVSSTGALPVTSAITGTSPVCANATGINYSVTNTVGSTYVWSVPSGASITSGQGTNAISVTWGASGGTISCTETNACGTGAAVTTVVAVTTLPVATFSYPASPFCQNASNPSPTYSGGGVAGTFTSVPAGLSMNASTGIVNLAASAPGTYTVTNTIASSGGCTIVTANSNITINPTQIATFGYGSSTFCTSGTNPTATITGTAGGTFTATPVGLVFVNASTGEIDIASTALNTYSITYTTAGPCAATSSLNVTITNAPSAAFSFVGTPYCQNASNPTPTFSGGASAGIFSATPAGLVFVSTATGEVDLLASTPGIYSVTNDIAASGGCSPATASSSITIAAVQSAAFNYSASNYCLAGTDPSPTITGVTGGTFSASPAGLSFVSTSTGQIDLSASALNSYTITYTTPGPCASSSTTTVTIVVAPTANFSYASSSYCQNGVDPLPTMGAGATPGVFTVSPAGLVIDTLDGDVTLATSIPGTYTVTNTVAAAGTCPAVTATTTITINAVQSGTFSYPLSTYCITASNPSPVFTGGAIAGTFTSSPAGLSINASTGAVNLAASVAGTYTVTNTISATGGCLAVVATSVIVVTAIPTINVNSPTICIGQSATLTASGASTYSWSTGGNTTSISVNPITNTTYTVTGSIGGCSNTSTSTVSVVAPPVAAASGSNVCAGQVLNLTATGGGTYSWTGPLAYISNLQNPSIANATTTNSGTYTVVVSNGACTNSASVSVTVSPLPSANAGSDVTVITGASTQLTASGGTTYSWSPATGLSCTNCSNPVATPVETTTYCVQVSNGSCTSSSCVTVTVETPCPDNKDLEVPNAFSPNDDGHNDKFCLRGWTDCIETFSVYIYDRWGEKVFESSDASFCWDGTYHGKTLDPAVFVYFIKASFRNDTKLEKKGNISLIR